MGSMYLCPSPLSEFSPMSPGYERMANAISDFSLSSGTPPLILSMCQWGRVRLHFVAIIELWTVFAGARLDLGPQIRAKLEGELERVSQFPRS